MRPTLKTAAIALTALLCLILLLRLPAWLLGRGTGAEQGESPPVVELGPEPIPLGGPPQEGAQQDEPAATQPEETKRPTEPQAPPETNVPNETQVPPETNANETHEDTQAKQESEAQEGAEEREPESEAPTVIEPEVSPAETGETELGTQPEDGEPEEGGVTPPSGSIQIGSRRIVEGAPGGTLTLMVPIRYLYAGQTYRSNADASGAAQPHGEASDYDQSIAGVLPWVRVSISASQDEGFPLAPEVRSWWRALISDGVNMGYAVFEDMPVQEDAEPGTHPVRLIIDWTDGHAEYTKTLTAYIRVGDTGEADDEPDETDEGGKEGIEDLPEEDGGEDAEDEDTEDEITDDEPDGDCLLLSVPQRLEFESVSLSGEPSQWIGLTGAMTVEVLDTRGTGSWTLRMTAGALTTADGKDTLPGTLVFVHPDGRVEPMPAGDPILVAEKQPDAEPGITTVTWPRGEGLHIHWEAEASPGARYTASVSWTLDVADDAEPLEISPQD